MKIATTYENGNVFQHFGRTEYFKVYEVEDGAVVSSEVIGSDGIGHGALAGLLANHDIQVLICGGLGGGALNALTNAGIEVCAGASGNADEAVAAYLRGELVDTGANCDHHHHGEGEECCGHGEGEDHECCGGHGHEEGEDHECCGGNGGGCCGGRRLTVEGKNAGKNVKVHYRGTFDDGSQFDSSYDRGEPLAFVCGAGMMIKGFDKAVADMEVGQIVDVHLMPEEAYGPSDPEAIITIEIAQLPGSENLEEGQRVYLRNMMGQPFPVTVTAKDDVHITLDANHEMAGKELNFRIELLEVTD
ncbi:MAG: FKBP-type peptidyl-prolyl cis-trans isomerase [Lachnospiraceae bacterium]|jgi:FKBP-type peptidyl-prolyl cis-trans isomerase 2/predicted Fe-Mo cluster-binding NifX family protein|nr:FKBP-type peptidyl-prolyl cis-trans isomerase [Lachnospiraceae bacterium]